MQVQKKQLHPTLGIVTVKSQGHFPDTVIVEDEAGHSFETQYKDLTSQGVSDETSSSKRHSNKTE